MRAGDKPLFTKLSTDFCTDFGENLLGKRQPNISDK
jgi:hypothetical protein